jgi:hypothetical protein
LASRSRYLDPFSCPDVATPDPDTKSGKARKAAELGVRRMAEPVFWRTLGVEID